MKKLLARMPKDVADSFTDTQLMHLKLAVSSRQWGKHKIDIRGTFPLPFMHKRIYYVFLLGRNFRSLSRSEKTISALTTTLFTSLFLIISTLFGLLVLYLVKSALGINLFDSFSLGIWGWFKGLWQ